MKMGIKEFRDRISEVTERGDPVTVTHHGREVGRYLPKRPLDPERARAIVEEIKAWQQELRDRGVDLDGILASLGMDPWGIPLDEVDR